MSFVEYLLIGLVTLLAFGGWATYTAFRRAEDGCEDVLGFHTGDRPWLIAPTRVAALAPNSTTPTTASLSPFEKQCAVTRAQASQVESADPFGGVLGQKTPDSEV